MGRALHWFRHLQRFFTRRRFERCFPVCIWPPKAHCHEKLGGENFLGLHSLGLCVWSPLYMLFCVALLYTIPGGQKRGARGGSGPSKVNKKKTKAFLTWNYQGLRQCPGTMLPITKDATHDGALCISIVTEAMYLRLEVDAL